MKRNEIIYTDAETFTPEEEITAENTTFAGKGGEIGKNKKSGKKTTWTAVIALFIAAAVLISGYFIFLHEPDVETEVNEFYLISAEAKDALEEIKATISFGMSEQEITADKNALVVYTFAEAVAECGNIKVKTGSGNAFCTISVDGKEKTYEKNEFFRFLDNGTAYAFDGENLFVNGILTLAGEENLPFALRAMEGYDTDGDEVTSMGKPFMYPAITRSDVLSITVKNQKTTFKVYRENTSTSTFYIEGAEGVDLQAEAFSYLIVNSTYTCAEGKLTNPKDFSQYGLDGDGSTAKVTIVTKDKQTHVLIIGDKDSTGAYNYARYEGKNHVYLLLNSDVESTFAAGGEKYLSAKLVYPIKDTNEIYNIDKMSIYYRDIDQSVTMRLRRAISASSNITISREGADVSTLLSDLKRMGGTYSDWTKSEAAIGLGSKNGEKIQFAISLNRISENGEYTVKIPMVRDEGKGAYLPSKITIYACTDGQHFNEVEVTGLDTLSTQKDGTYYVHQLTFKSKDAVQYVRIDMEGYTDKKLFVTDEIRIMSGELDANPADAFVGLWMITTDAFTPENRNYGYVNTTNYVEFLMSVCTLVGDEVVDFGITDEDLVKYGFGVWDKDDEGKDIAKLDPAAQVHYVYGNYTMDILLTDPAEDGSRYVMSMITSYDSKGDEVKFINPYIARLSLETAPWMAWEPLDFVSDSILYMYLDDIEEIKFTYGGNSYNFVTEEDDLSTVIGITCNGQKVDIDQFRQVFLSVLHVSRNGEYEQGDEEGSEMLRINVTSETKKDELVFYRVTSTKAYYTIDGAGGYYTLTYEVSEVIDRLESLLAGEPIS